MKRFLTVIIDPLTVSFLAGMLAYYNNEKESKLCCIERKEKRA
ncbi:hypothetical protein [Bacillus cereus]